MKRNCIKSNGATANSTKSCSTKARDLMCKMSVIPDWHPVYFHKQKFRSSRPYSSPCRAYSRTGFQGAFRPFSSTTAVANPVLSILDVKRLLFQKIASKGDELRRAFQLLDPDQSLTVSKRELRRVIADFLMPLTKEQFQDVLAQIPLTSSGAVPYPEFLSKFGRIDLNVSVTKRGGGTEPQCCRTLKELETQIGEKVFRNIKAVIKAFRLIDVNRTGLVQPQELRRVLEAFCLNMSDGEYAKFSRHYGLDRDAPVDYSGFLKNLSINSDLNLRYIMQNPELAGVEQPTKDPPAEHRRGSAPTEADWSDCSLEDIERTFCQELSKSYEKIEKALSAGDPSKGGFVSLTYLKVVLDTFVHHLPRRVFIQLMKRFGLRTTSRINWKQFLTSFNEPQGLEGNSLAPLARRNGLGSRSQPRAESAAAKLLRLAEDRCVSLKKVLQVIHSKPDGQITGEELRHVLNCMVAKLSDSEFKELMRTLDPRATGVVSVSQFTALLEEKPKTKKAPPAADSKVPPPLAWDSVEETVHDALARNLPAFYKMLQSYDLGDTGLIGRNNFKKIMQIFCPFLTNEHIIKLCSGFRDSASGRILHKKLLACIGVGSPPGASPAPPPKEQPSGGGRPPREEQQPAALPERSKPAEDKGAPAKCMTKEEVIARLKTCIRQQDPAFRKRFLAVSKEPHGKIGVRAFRKVLEDSGMPMTDSQYALLAAKIGYRDDGMSYLDFTAGFEGAAMSGQEAPLPQTPAPAPAQSHPCSHFVTAEECLQLLPRRLAESFRDPYSAFFKMDTDRDGIVSMRDLHGLLLHLFSLRDEEFERLLGLLGLRLSVTLNFREFRSLFEQSPPGADEAPQRVVRLKQRVADSDLACEQAHQYLVTKAKNRWADLSKNFIETDNEGNGILRRRDIKNALYGFDIPLTPREFEKLWQSWGVSLHDNSINLADFLRALESGRPGPEPPDKEEDGGVVVDFSTVTLPEVVRSVQQVVGSCQPALSQAFSALDKEDAGFVKAAEFGDVLRAFCHGLVDSQYHHLLRKLRLHLAPYVHWKYFLENFGSFREEMADEWVEEMPKGPPPPSPRDGAGRDVLARLHRAVASHYHAIAQEFENFDTMKSNTVSRDEFRAVCTRHVQILTDEQFDRLWSEMPVSAKGRLKYLDFLSRFSSEHTATPAASGDSAGAQRGSSVPELSESTRSAVALPSCELSAGLKPRSHSRTPPSAAADAPLQNCEPIESRLRKKLQGCWRELLRECKAMDTDRRGEVTAAQFLGLVEKFSLDVSPEESRRLLAKYDLRNTGRFAYCAFLQSCVLLLQAKETSLLHRLKIQNAHKMEEAGAETASFYAALLRIQPKIVHCWRPMRRTFKTYDASGSGLLSVADFRKVLRLYSINLSEEEFFHILEYYDKTLSSRISYNDFLRAFLQ
ncbi:EF-hand calcium-binding domain-containing protein 6 isoform X3 [Oryctolagus cuniculus]|uniref:EF-hand calcium-binding domain-containing protein 6 isoform X3 n=1 Tax=Oryctolagus cuniculus TaxID=9986 RepID=UPI00387973A0